MAFFGGPHHDWATVQEGSVRKPRRPAESSRGDTAARARTRARSDRGAGQVTTKGKSEAARVAAANALLDRGWGRPKPSDESEVTYRYVVELPRVPSRDEWQRKYGQNPMPDMGNGGDKAAGEPSIA